MRKLLLMTLAFGSIAVISTACTGDDDDDDDGPTVDATGRVNGDSGGGDSTPLVGATVEVSGTSNSVMTVSSGAFTISVPQDEAVFLKASAASYYSAQRGVIAGAGGLTDINLNMPSNAIVTGVAGALGITIDPTLGILSLNFDATSVGTAGGYSATIGAAAEGSFVFTSSGDPALGTVTPPNSSTLIFYGVATGDTTIVVDAPGAITCTPEFAITNYTISASTITSVLLDCQ